MVSISGWFDVYANPKLATYGVRVDLVSCQPIASGYCQFWLVVHTTENENKSSSLLLSRLVRWYFMKLEHRRVHCSGYAGPIAYVCGEFVVIHGLILKLAHVWQFKCTVLLLVHDARTTWRCKAMNGHWLLIFWINGLFGMQSCNFRYFFVMFMLTHMWLWFIIGCN
ncbi:uncharacterized protein LOC127108025 isoform X2 [Lathyrus oleraceus]|uniref:uncharacterized protein LOC127108025 isoform X2 n=1 Tax=Pisum sativum TaxID=3888 RepID=UPI0021D042B7|nr:uncharacterized protein LOC127108025 isoform X2 [Pisum sativum]